MVLKAGDKQARAERPLLVVSSGNTFDTIRDREGDFDDWIVAGLGGHRPTLRIDARDMSTIFPEPASLAGVVVSGSHEMVTDHAPWSERLAGWIRECVAASTPLLGICYGHQLLAYAMGGKVGYHPGGIEIGTHEVALCDEGMNDVLFMQLPKSFPAHLVHSQSVLKLPAGATLLAGNRQERHQAFRIGRSAWGVQFHPEFSSSIMQAYIREVGAQNMDSNVFFEQMLRTVTDTPSAQSLLGRFSELVVMDLF